MLKSPFQRLLMLAISSLAVLGAADFATAACPPPKPAVCDPDFTGRTADTARKCVFPPPRPCEVRGPRGKQGEDGARGKRGFKGEKGATGETGARGADGVAGAAGATGLQGLQGIAGAVGAAGIQGVAGAIGAVGAAGIQGVAGAIGAVGAAGADGPAGPPGPAGQTGQTGAQGPTGPQGTTGQAGPAGLDAPAEYAEFFALMPKDNAATVGAGQAVNFPQDGPSTGEIARLDSGEFVLPETGTYRVAFSVPVDEAGQLQLTLDGVALDYTVSGRATGTSQIAGEALVETTGPGAILAVVNPRGNTTALTITPLAGGEQPAAAWLIIERLPEGP